MKEPLNGNLALTFLFKNSDIGELIKTNNVVTSRATEQNSANLTSNNSVLGFDEDEVPHVPVSPQSVPGYYKKKNKIKIGNINDFINKLRKLVILQEYFKQDDPEFGGVKKLFSDFMNKMKTKVLESPYLRNDHQQHLDEINSYVLT